MPEKLIQNRASLVSRASYLRIATASLATAMQGGAFRSLQKGRGIEFAGVREYFRGDDVRAIDWNVTARSGRPFVKVFEEEREIQILLIVDRSLSMQSLSVAKSRLECASEIAALITFSAEHNDSPVGALLFSDRIEFAIKPQTGGDHTMLLISRLESLPEKSQGSVLSKALFGAGQILKRRAMVFVISDFRVSGWEDAFALLALRHDVVALRVFDEIDFDLPKVGAVTFTDGESGTQRLFPTQSAVFQRRWNENAVMREKRWREAVTRRGGYPLSVSTSEDALLALCDFFSKRERA